MPVIPVSTLDHPGVSIFAGLTGAQLRTAAGQQQGIFIAESPKVIDVALNAGCEPLSMLTEQKHIEGDAAHIIARYPDIPVYTGPRELLARITGYTLTRGVLCAMRRPTLPGVADICMDAHRIAVIHAVTDSTNTGAIFRSAAALGIDGILLTPDSCDPLCRRAVRVSMGSVFLVPWTWCTSGYHDELSRLGFKTAAMALSNESIPLDDPVLKAQPRLAVIMGTEGDGLPAQAIAASDYTVRIPMSHNVDSLNVAAAAAVTFWELRR